jgi:hypothetical protein
MALPFRLEVLPLPERFSDKMAVRRKVTCHRRAVDFVVLPRRLKYCATGRIDSRPPKTAADRAASFVVVSSATLGLDLERHQAGAYLLIEMLRAWDRVFATS